MENATEQDHRFGGQGIQDALSIVRSNELYCGGPETSNFAIDSKRLYIHEATEVTKDATKISSTETERQLTYF